ncbi:hypothetical protein KB206_10810 [Microvirga sp. STS02]|uniref:hypothetical protein n=1 Tax=Hymenobacter negativus TaxID=2795026 RepID=UPI0018DDA563|nr:MULTISPECIES: hypothetical protein [Bacteria]MBH8569377.1 hypothetical protein [Hymenobacter negativus]MBR7209111.1 hypothetical protein [Microvirga sp. STS02]
MTAHAPYLRILREPATIDLPPARMSPAEIALTLSADVLRLPYPPATRLVLAEIVSLHAANAGLCDASDAHFAARLTVSKDTVSVAVQLLEKDGLVVKVVQRLPTGFYRTLAPVPAAIAAKAATNPYPENAGSPTRNFRVGPTRKMPVGYPEIPATPTRNLPVPLPGNSGSNTPLNSTDSFHIISTPTTGAADAAAAGSKKNKDEELADIDVAQSATAQPAAPTPAPRCEAPPKPAKADKKDKAAKSGEPEHFPAFWAAWPKKEGKIDAQRAFAKLAADDRAAAASRADAWLTARPDLSDPARYRYIPHASTWLNQQRWTDEAPLISSTANPSAHATASTGSSYGPRPANGAKPSANAGKLSRALFGRLAE